MALFIICNRAALSNVATLFIGLDAKKLVDDNLKSLKLSPDTKIEAIANHIQQDLAQLHQSTPKAVLIEVTNAALIHSEQVINEHNKQKQVHEIDNHVNNGDAMKAYNLTKADLPILGLMLASNILRHHQNIDGSNTHTNTIQNDSHEHQQQGNLQHSINIAISSFKSRIAQDSMHFEQHQQQTSTSETNDSTSRYGNVMGRTKKKITSKKKSNPFNAIALSTRHKG